MNINIEKIQASFTSFLFVCVLILVGIAIFLFIFRKKIKRLAIPSVYLITGAVKTFKTGLSVWLALKTITKNKIAYYFGKLIWIICKHTTEGYYEYAPKLYTNIPLRIKHCRLTYQMVYRQVRVPNKSVFLIDEASLFADAMTFKDQRINDRITLFFKLFGHYTHGGTCIVNTQAVSDMHYAFRRAMGRYLYIYDNQRFPFITLVRGREMIASDDTGMVNQVNSDLEESMRWVFVPFFVSP